MITAELHPKEKKRLAALQQTGLLDTQTTDDFQEMVDLAASICETPIALISLVDQERQWFLARHGLDASETHRDLAFCAHAIHQEDLFVVSDAILDERFADNPLVTGDPSIRFYAGAPLIDAEGNPLGTICAIDRRPRQLNAHQQKALEALSRVVIRDIQRRQATKELQKSQEKLTNLLNQQSKFSLQASHEIRDLLHSSTGFSQLIAQGSSDLNLPKDFMLWTKLLGDSTSRLANLVSNVIDMNQLDDGKIKPVLRTCIPSEWFPSFVDRHREQAQNKSITLKLALSPQTPVQVVSDLMRLDQALSHILDNAIKHSPPGERILIAVDQGPSDGLRVVIRDNGEGMLPEDQERIWLPFEQVKDEQEGSGLGLALTRQLMKLLKGGIHLSSHKNTGTAVSIAIPSLDADRKQSSTKVFHAQIGAPLPRFWLVINSDPVANALLKAQAQSFGCSCEVRPSSDNLDGVIKTLRPDVVLMGQHIPNENSMLNWQQLKVRSTKLPPVILMASDASMTTKMHAKDAGMDEVLAMPIRSKQLRSSLIRINTL